MNWLYEELKKKVTIYETQYKRPLTERTNEGYKRPLIVKSYELRLGRHPFIFCLENYANLLYSNWNQQFNFSKPAFENYSHYFKDHNNALFSFIFHCSMEKFDNLLPTKKSTKIFFRKKFYLI